MSIICETDNFIVKAATLPHVYVSREEGGHIQIKPKVPVHDRTQLSLDLATEYIFLSMVVGESMQSALGRRGINIGLVNYQEMGNWSVFKPEGPKMHMHLFGRAIDAAIQKYGEGVLLPHLDTGFYDAFEPLNGEDIIELRTDIEKLLESEKYKGRISLK